MFTKSAGALTDGLNASGDVLDQYAVVSLTGGGIMALGQPVVRDLSQLVNVAEGASINTTPQNVVPGTSVFTNQSDILLASNATANVGDVVGVVQAPSASIAVGGPTTARPVYIRRLGIGWVFAGVNAGGTALSVGALLITSGTFPFAVVGARAFGVNVGRITAFPVNTTLGAAVLAPGAQTVQIASAFGINTTTSLTVDSGTQAEALIPTAVSYGVNASQTITIAGTASAGTTIAGNIGGVAYSYTTTAGDTTATIAAANVVAAINRTAAAAGLSPVVQPVTNTAGVITAVGIAPGTAANATTITATATGGTFTATAGGATLAGGANATITATFAKTHSSGVNVQGITSSGTLVTAPATGYFALPVVADINTLL